MSEIGLYTGLDPNLFYGGIIAFIILFVIGVMAGLNIYYRDRREVSKVVETHIRSYIAATEKMNKAAAESFDIDNTLHYLNIDRADMVNIVKKIEHDFNMDLDITNIDEYDTVRDFILEVSSQIE